MWEGSLKFSTEQRVFGYLPLLWLASYHLTFSSLAVSQNFATDTFCLSIFIKFFNSVQLVLKRPPRQQEKDRTLLCPQLSTLESSRSVSY